jgi:hypothetical protein
MDSVSPETCWASYKHGIINFDALLYLVGYFCMNYTMMHGSTNIKSVISLCLSVLFVMGEHTNSLRKFPTLFIMCVCGLIITLSICSAQVVSQHLHVFNCLCHKHRMNTAISTFLFAIKGMTLVTKNVLCSVLLVSFKAGPVPKIISTAKPASWPGLVQICDVHFHILSATFFHTVHY